MLPSAQVTMHEPGIIAPPPLPRDNRVHQRPAVSAADETLTIVNSLGQVVCYILHLQLLMLLMIGQFGGP